MKKKVAWPVWEVICPYCGAVEQRDNEEFFDNVCKTDCSECEEEIEIVKPANLEV